MQPRFYDDFLFYSSIFAYLRLRTGRASADFQLTRHCRLRWIQNKIIGRQFGCVIRKKQFHWHERKLCFPARLLCLNINAAKKVRNGDGKKKDESDRFFGCYDFGIYILKAKIIRIGLHCILGVYIKNL